MKIILVSIWFLPFAVLAADTNALPVLVPAYGEMRTTFWEQHSTAILTWTPFLLALLAFAIWALVQPRLQPAPPPAERAREALARLKGRPEDGAVIVAISQILREYVGAAFRLPPGALTTADVASALAGNEKLGTELAEKISSFLRECDDRKFSTTPARLPLGGAHRALMLIAMAEQRRTTLPLQPSTAR